MIKRGLIILVVLTMSLLVGGVYGSWMMNKPYIPATFTSTQEIASQSEPKRYHIKKNHKIIDEYESEEEAIKVAYKKPRSIVVDTHTGDWVYSSLQPFMIITEHTIHDFESYDSAIKYARKNNYEYVHYKNDKTLLWDNKKENQGYPLIQVPLIKQLPELPRGCEVTSLAMLFEYYGQPISKMRLAKEIKKDPTPYSKKTDGKIYYGNPYDGFVGDMYDIRKNGYGVYHGPIAELAKTYFSTRVIDATGVEFEDLLEFVERGIPVLIITNATYRPLLDTEFELWHTPTEIVKVTKRMHAVVITGANDSYIYVNDPLYSKPNRKLDRKNFKEAWEQMGKQAVVILP
ncbi:MAG: C39 family peptidase [Cellulosilyticaceae bacterium]